MVSLSSFFPFLFLLEKKFTLLQDQLETLETSLPQPSPQWDYRVIHYTVNNFFCISGSRPEPSLTTLSPQSLGQNLSS